MSIDIWKWVKVEDNVWVKVKFGILKNILIDGFDFNVPSYKWCFTHLERSMIKI